MKKLEVKDLKENFFEAIGKEWMLVTAGTKEKFNTMTASWGGIGWLWNKPVAFVFIRPERYTYEFVEKNDYFQTQPLLSIDTTLRISHRCIKKQFAIDCSRFR